MIDNLNIIKPLLLFEDEEHFYYLQILQRKKENDDLKSNSRVIKEYFISNLQYLEDRYDEIKKLCDVFNARAMINLNRRSKRKIALETLRWTASMVADDVYDYIHRAYSHTCGKYKVNDGRWIVDIDGVYKQEYLMKIQQTINNLKPEGPKVITEIPSKNGIHFITKPFDRFEFSKVFTDIDIHTNNPTNLYIP